MNSINTKKIYGQFGDRYFQKEEVCCYTPTEVVQLLSRLLDPPSDKILELCSESRGLLIGASIYCKSLSAESKLVLERWNDDGSGEKKNWGQWENKLPEERYECIIINPPFGYVNSKRYGNRLENQFLQHAVHLLRKDGHCMAIVPNGVLGRKADADVSLRRMLCDEFHINCVIMLPLSAFPQAEVYTSILHIENCSGEGRKTQLYDLRNCLSLSEICECYESSQPEVVLSHNDLAKHQFALLPEVYRRFEEKHINPTDTKKEEILQNIHHIQKEINCSVSEDINGQTYLFPNAVPCNNEKQKLKKLIAWEYELLTLELSRFLLKTDFTVIEGYKLYDLKNGERCPKNLQNGSYTLYGAGGAYGTAYRSNMNTDNAIILSRVGSSCGNAFRAWKQGFVSDNAIIVTPHIDLVIPDFLVLLLCSACFNRTQRGTGQPYITQDVVYEEWYRLPNLKQQDNFLKKYEAVLENIKVHEQKLEVQ